jgi:cbb3-type cytochrome oxidase subunit 3
MTPGILFLVQSIGALLGLAFLVFLICYVAWWIDERRKNSWRDW